jgi:hypothetical protein
VKQDIVRNKALLENERTAEGFPYAECVDRVRDYLARTGMAVPDFARRIGYGTSSLRLFLSGSYHNVAGTYVHMVKAANDFMDVHPAGQSCAQLGELYETANVRAIRSTFSTLLEKPVAHMIYAPPGSQKSFVLEHEVANLNRTEARNEGDGAKRAFYIYARIGIRPRDLMRRVAIACGCRIAGEVDSMIRNLRFEFRNKRVVLAIDEAQHLSIECFETIRELLDQPPHFSLLFAGSHDLKVRFDQFSAILEQWNSRIVAKVRLPGIEPAEAEGIIRRELGSHLESLDAAKAKKKIDGLIHRSTVRDAFEANRTYINIRALTNALSGLKSNLAN